jgi:hypothetical protein
MAPSSGRRAHAWKSGTRRGTGQACVVRCLERVSAVGASEATATKTHAVTAGRTIALEMILGLTWGLVGVWASGRVRVGLTPDPFPPSHRGETQEGPFVPRSPRPARTGLDLCRGRSPDRWSCSATRFQVGRRGAQMRRRPPIQTLPPDAPVHQTTRRSCVRIGSSTVGC